MDIKESRMVVGADSKGNCVYQGSSQDDLRVCSVGLCKNNENQMAMECLLVSDLDYEDIDTLIRSKNS